MTSIAINELKNILSEKPLSPRVKMENPSFVADYFSAKFHEFLSPDSDPYRSVINPVFSFEFEIGAKNLIGLVDIFSLRDGVLPLMRFFAINPYPQEHFSPVIIDSRLSSLVPEEWREKVILRDTFVRPLSDRDEKIVFFISPDSDSLPMDLFVSELEKVKRMINSENELYILFSSMRIRGQGHSAFDSGWGYKCLQKIISTFPDHQIHPINNQEYYKLDMTKSRFHFINPLNFYFTDSYLFHDAAGKGAGPLVEHKLKDHSALINLSFNHGFSFHQSFTPFIGEEYKKVQQALYPQVMTYAKSGQWRDVHSSFFPRDFVDWSKDVARELFISAST